MSTFDPDTILDRLTPEDLNDLLEELTRRALRGKDYQQDCLYFQFGCDEVGIFNYYDEDEWQPVKTEQLLMGDEGLKEWKEKERAQEAEAEAKREAEEALRIEKQNAQTLQRQIKDAQTVRDNAKRRALRAQEVADAELAAAEADLESLKGKRPSYPNSQHVFES